MKNSSNFVSDGAFLLKLQLRFNAIKLFASDNVVIQCCYVVRQCCYTQD